jgi:hypothetical protein
MTTRNLSRERLNFLLATYALKNPQKTIYGTLWKRSSDIDDRPMLLALNALVERDTLANIKDFLVAIPSPIRR